MCEAYVAGVESGMMYNAINYCAYYETLKTHVQLMRWITIYGVSTHR